MKVNIVKTNEEPDLTQYISFKLEEFLKWKQEGSSLAPPHKKRTPNGGETNGREE